ncbi:AraC family transcriptional regulator [Kitasatospora aureofaciens]|uniref:AraC family transcriptional regulator n=1 Tax=Kitasatospora aureofaciens TaxID=1894 RepID=A0A1E7MVM9_KITAU|nr:AraC family transcriptional regulator [Kitasatospora aureofaciens]GGU68635.1 AraC family transcriptional regulator [Kitasatospora aureofaciens]
MAARSVFRGEGVPAKERFDCWRELIGRTRASEMTSVHADDFRAEMRRLELGPVTLLRSSFPPTRFRRTAAMVRRADPQVYHLTMPLGGGLSLSRGAREGARAFGPGDLYLVDSSTPYDVRAVGVRVDGRRERRTDAVGIDFPASLLPLPPERLRDLLGRGFSVREGTCALLSEFLVGLDRQAAVLGPGEAARLGTVAVDLVAAWLARELEAEAALPDDARRRALVQSVRSFVRRRLHDPELSPSVIAAAHHVSVSHLHRVFSGQSRDGVTLAAWIRGQRLERARRDLADPALRALPVHVVAARWGIPRASDFSRSFRAAYGLSPREHRQRELAGGTSAGGAGAAGA